MKKLLLLLLLPLFLISCSSDDSSSSIKLSNTPEAVVAYDNSNFGIYKGVFVGSTGTILINFMNDGVISAKLTIDGKTYNFTTEDEVTEGELTDLHFVSGNMDFYFMVESDGSNPYIDGINIPGHSGAAMYIIKETSEHLVRCYQGTFKGDSSGTLNLIVYENEIYGLAKSSEDDNSSELEGYITENNTIVGYFEGGTFEGTINENSVSGTWMTINEDSGTWSGTRKL